MPLFSCTPSRLVTLCRRMMLTCCAGALATACLPANGGTAYSIDKAKRELTTPEARAVFDREISGKPQPDGLGAHLPEGFSSEFWWGSWHQTGIHAAWFWLARRRGQHGPAYMWLSCALLGRWGQPRPSARTRHLASHGTTALANRGHGSGCSSETREANPALWRVRRCRLLCQLIGMPATSMFLRRLTRITPACRPEAFLNSGYVSTLRPTGSARMNLHLVCGPVGAKGTRGEGRSLKPCIFSELKEHLCALSLPHR